jgi:hypothetical protein
VKNTVFPIANLGTGIIGFLASDGELVDISQYCSIGASISLIPGVSFAVGIGTSDPTGYEQSHMLNGQVNLFLLIKDITLDPRSPAIVPMPSSL